ncbi:MAG: recombinase family protein, partial [Anaerotignum sp.]
RKIHAALGVKMQEGAYIGAFAPYGYRKDPKNKNHLLVDEAAGAVVRRMFAMAKEGYSPSQIADRFNAEGILTPSQYRYHTNPQLAAEQLRSAGEWKATNINKMLRNESYLGHTLQGKTCKPSFKSKYCYARPREEWVVVRNTHEPLVDEETWDIVRKRMQSRARKREKGFVNLFSGSAKCADCGKNMSTVGTRKKGATANLSCGGYKLGGRQSCTSHTIDYDVLYQAVLTALREQLHLSEQEKERLLQVLENEQGDAAEDKEKRGQLRRRIDAFTDLQALDAELLFQLIECIEIHQGAYMAGEKQQRIDIWLRFPCEQRTMELTFAPK